MIECVTGDGLQDGGVNGETASEVFVSYFSIVGLKWTVLALSNANPKLFVALVDHIKIGDRAFSVAGPVIWNSIRESVRSVDNVHTFKCLLKTHFF